MDRLFALHRLSAPKFVCPKNAPATALLGMSGALSHTGTHTESSQVFAQLPIVITSIILYPKHPLTNTHLTWARIPVRSYGSFLVYFDVFCTGLGRFRAVWSDIGVFESLPRCPEPFCGPPVQKNRARASRAPETPSIFPFIFSLLPKRPFVIFFTPEKVVIFF